MKKRNRLKNLTSSLLTLAFAVVPLASTLVAQIAVPAQPVPVGVYEVPADAVGVVPGMGMPSPEMLGGAKQYQLLNQYEIEVGRIHTAVKLEDAQRSKLAVGAKGLAKEKTQEFIKSTGMMMGGGIMPVGGPPAAKPKPKKEEPQVKFAEVKSFADVDINTKFMLENGFTQETKPSDDADWLKLVKSVLKPEQYLKYEQAIAAQKQNLDKTMVDAGMAALSIDLMLSNEQESKLAALVLEQLAKPKPAPDADDPAAMGVMIMGMEGLRFTMELAKVESQKIRDVLDPQQFELIDLKLGLLRGITAMNAAGIAAPIEEK